MKQFWLYIRETVEVVAISLFTVFIIRTYLVQPFLVSGASMEPNFQNGNYLLIDEITYRFREPERGEVVVFRYPGDHKTFYIKRVIGLPGERVVVKNGEVFVYSKENQKEAELKESYLPAHLETVGNADETLGDNEYFVMGDNRAQSADSRIWGPVPKENVIGRPIIRFLPPALFPGEREYQVAANQLR